MGKETEFLVLAGGVGTRLKEITEQSIPKCAVNIRFETRGIDILLSQLKKVGANATFSSNNYFYQYEEFIRKTDCRMLWQKPGGITQAVLQTGNRVITIANDCIFPFEQLRKMIEQHVPGTVSWAVTSHRLESMSEYSGCDIDKEGRILGRNDQSIVRSPTIIVDPETLKLFVKDPASDNLFGEVMRRMEEENLKRKMTGQRSILNAFFLRGPIIDFGTPERLNEAAEILDYVLYPKK